MSDNNWNDEDRPGKLNHHSARGRLNRNAGNFTRGSQLITHELLMWFASAKLPPLVAFFLFALLLALTMALRLGDHEVQMILMKSYALGWDWLALDPKKIVNLTNGAGDVIKAPITMVGSHPDVVAAWGRFMRCLFGSAFITACVTMPLTHWFVRLSHRRGKTILDERHQRGAMLVDGVELAQVINAHNGEKLAEEVAQRCPGSNVASIVALPLAARKAAGIHHAYTLAGIPYPWRTEQAHTMLIGTTGTGKTTQMRDMIAQMRARQHRAVVFDLTGAYVEAFYNPKTDIILNPMDARCPSWSIFMDCETHADFTSAAAALVPFDGGAGEPFWTLAARTLFVETCMKLKAMGETSNQALANRLMMADLKQVHAFLQHTVADPLTAPEAARMAESIRAVFNTNAQALRFLPQDNPPFSICDWVAAEDKPGSILFITSTHNELTLNRALLTLWMNLAVHRLMRLPRTRDLRTWFFFDEVHALHRLPAIEDGLQTARGFGGAFVLGIHSLAKLSETYGEEGARNLASLARTKLILATADRDTAEHCSGYIGSREVRMMDEAYSYGYSNIRDSATITPRSEIQPLVLPDDIMKLPSLRGFVVFPEGFDAARISLTYKDYPVVADAYAPRKTIEPLAYQKPEPPKPDDGEASGREGEIAPTPEAKNGTAEPAAPDGVSRTEAAQNDLFGQQATPPRNPGDVEKTKPVADRPEDVAPKPASSPSANAASANAEPKTPPVSAAQAAAAVAKGVPPAKNGKGASGDPPHNGGQSKASRAAKARDQGPPKASAPMAKRRGPDPGLDGGGALDAGDDFGL